MHFNPDPNICNSLLQWFIKGSQYHNSYSCKLLVTPSWLSLVEADMQITSKHMGTHLELHHTVLTHCSRLLTYHAFSDNVRQHQDLCILRVIQSFALYVITVLHRIKRLRN